MMANKTRTLRLYFFALIPLFIGLGISMWLTDSALSNALIKEGKLLGLESSISRASIYYQVGFVISLILAVLVFKKRKRETKAS